MYHNLIFLTMFARAYTAPMAAPRSDLLPSSAKPDKINKTLCIALSASVSILLILAIILWRVCTRRDCYPPLPRIIYGIKLRYMRPQEVANKYGKRIKALQDISQVADKFVNIDGMEMENKVESMSPVVEHVDDDFVVGTQEALGVEEEVTSPLVAHVVDRPVRDV